MSNIDLEALIAELDEEVGEFLFEIEIEEEDCFHILFISVWVDPDLELVLSEKVVEVTLPKAEIGMVQ